jgi:hypothetical protein
MDIGEIHVQLHNIQSDNSRSDELISLVTDQHAFMNVLQVDIETFILFARIFMDRREKLSSLAENNVNPLYVDYIFFMQW